MDEWIVDVISFQKIFGLCGLKCHIMEIWRDVTLEDDEQRTDGRNVKIGLEFWKQNSQFTYPGSSLSEATFSSRPFKGLNWLSILKFPYFVLKYVGTLQHPPE